MSEPKENKEYLDFRELILLLKKDIEGTKNHNHLDSVRKDLKAVLKELEQSTEVFNPAQFTKKLRNYIDKNNRFLYSEISGYVNGLSETAEDSKLPSVLSNLDNLYEYQYELSDDEEIKKVIIKLLDHINLANYQINTLKLSEEGFQERISPYTEKVLLAEEELRKTKKEIYTQLISIVSIFVAISFVMFGGMSLLNNLFDYSKMSNVPLLEMLCGGSLIGLVMVLVVYSFMLFVLKLIDSNYTNLPFRKGIVTICIVLGIIVLITGSLWFMNIRSVEDINYINTQCKTIEYDNKTKSVTLVCPANIDNQ